MNTGKNKNKERAAFFAYQCNVYLFNAQQNKPNAEFHSQIKICDSNNNTFVVVQKLFIRSKIFIQ